jgi:hypothetical protein
MVTVFLFFFNATLLQEWYIKFQIIPLFNKGDMYSRKQEARILE